MEQESSKALEVLSHVASVVPPASVHVAKIQKRLDDDSIKRARVVQALNDPEQVMHSNRQEIIRQEKLQKTLAAIDMRMQNNLSELQQLTKMTTEKHDQIVAQINAAQAMQDLGKIDVIQREELTNLLRQTGLKLAIEQEFINLEAKQGTSLQNLMALATLGPSKLNAELTMIINHVLVRDSTIPLTLESIKIIKEYLKDEDTFKPRVLLGDVSTRNQCDRTIGEAIVIKDFNFLTEDPCKKEVRELVLKSAEIDVLTYPPHSHERKSRCWLCGLPLGPRDLGPLSPQCEHVLPVALAATFFDIYDTQAAERLTESGTLENYLEAISENYSWAHACCNALEKGHFDANQHDPIIRFEAKGVEGGELKPVYSTYEQIVNGWVDPVNGRTPRTGIINRLLEGHFALHCLSPKEREEWAKKRVDIIYRTYDKRCKEINKKLKEFPTLYPLSLAAYYLSNASNRIKQIMKSPDLMDRLAGPVVPQGQAGPSNAAPPQGGKKTKRKRKHKKKLRHVNKYKTNKKSRKNKSKKIRKN